MWEDHGSQRDNLHNYARKESNGKSCMPLPFPDIGQERPWLTGQVNPKHSIHIQLETRTGGGCPSALMLMLCKNRARVVR
jgi:hypothetical protein